MGFFFVTSDIFKLLMIASFKCDYEKIYITGQSRTDSIFNSNKKISEIIDDVDGKIVFYSPTYKEIKRTDKREVEKEFTNIFYMDDYDKEYFINFLEKNKITFILKPHPFDEWFYRDYNPESNRVLVIYSDTFTSKNIYTYEIFNSIDVMISDFSSIVIDFAITKKPIIILDALTNEYVTNRGFILEDNFYDIMPGERVSTFKHLMDVLEKQIYEPKCNYADMLERLHKYADGNSCARITSVMKSL